MILNYYYLIRPNQVLRGKLRLQDPEVSEYLEAPVFWARGEELHYTIPVEYRLIQIKLLFLTEIIRMLIIGNQEEKKEFRQLAKELLGEPPFDFRVFDK